MTVPSPKAADIDDGYTAKPSRVTAYVPVRQALAPVLRVGDRGESGGRVNSFDHDA